MPPLTVDDLLLQLNPRNYLTVVNSLNPRKAVNYVYNKIILELEFAGQSFVRVEESHRNHPDFIHLGQAFIKEPRPKNLEAFLAWKPSR